MIKYILVLICAIIIAIPSTQSQTFEPLDRKFIENINLVDSLLISDNIEGLLPVGKDKLPLIYYELIEKQNLISNDYGMSPLDEFSLQNPRTGRRGKDRIYQTPNIYYAILDLPNNKGRFYGAITCGYNSIEEIMESPQTLWHPYSEVILLKGVIVKPNGTEENFTLHDKATTKFLTRPVGSYWAHDVLGFQDINFVFNQNGTGSIICYYYKIKWTLMALSGSFKTKFPNERHARKIDRFTGGYAVWMQPIGKRSFKWKINESNEIVITPFGSATSSIEEDIVGVSSRQLNQSEINRQNKADFKTNKESQISRNYLKKQIKKNVEAIDEIIIKPDYILADEILGNISSSVSFKEYIEYPEMEMEEWRFRLMENDRSSMNIIQEESGETKTFLGSKKPIIYEVMLEDYFLKSIMDLPFIYFSNLDGIENFINKHRTIGAKIEYSKMVKQIRNAITQYPEVFENTKSYQVEDINPINKTALIFFTFPNKIYSVEVAYNDKGEIDLETLKDSKINLDLISKKLDQIEEMNNQILLHKKDKDKNKRKKVKNYEKIYNEFLKTQNINFTMVDEVLEICTDLNEFIKKQKEIKDSL